MARHRFGDGRYRYFDHPLPDTIAALRSAFYRPARTGRERLVGAAGRARRTRSRSSTRSCSTRCRAAGQERPTPLILRYGAGDWNALHQDLYGDVFFPFQVADRAVRARRSDYEGGEFVLLEQRPRAQSRAHVLRPPRGAFVIFPTQQRPQARQARLPPRRHAPRREHGDPRVGGPRSA